MVLEVNQISTLLASDKLNKNRSSYDLITGADTQLPSSLLSGVFGEVKPNLTKNQVSTLDTLSSFVSDNLKGDEAAKLQGDIAALKKLNSLANDESKTYLDPVFSLLANNSDARNAISNGSIVDQIL